jgi:hypothetical protein
MILNRTLMESAGMFVVNNNARSSYAPTVDEKARRQSRNKHEEDGCHDGNTN